MKRLARVGTICGHHRASKLLNLFKKQYAGRHGGDPSDKLVALLETIGAKGLRKPATTAFFEIMLIKNPKAADFFASLRNKGMHQAVMAALGDPEVHRLLSEHMLGKALATNLIKEVGDPIKVSGFADFLLSQPTSPTELKDCLHHLKSLDVAKLIRDNGPKAAANEIYFQINPDKRPKKKSRKSWF